MSEESWSRDEVCIMPRLKVMELGLSGRGHKNALLFPGWNNDADSHMLRFRTSLANTGVVKGLFANAIAETNDEVADMIDPIGVSGRTLCSHLSLLFCVCSRHCQMICVQCNFVVIAGISTRSQRFY